jgi:hypothetical protein
MAPKRIYVYDGSYLQVYDPQNNSWTFGANPPTSRQYLGIAVVNDLLYFIGGFTYTLPGFFNDFATNEQYTPIGYGTIQPANEPTGLVYAAAAAGVTATAAIVVAAVYIRKRKQARKGS